MVHFLSNIASAVIWPRHARFRFPQTTWKGCDPIMNSSAGFADVACCSVVFWLCSKREAVIPKKDTFLANLLDREAHSV